MLVALIGTARYAPTPAAAASGAWTGDFYNNKTLSNPKVITVTDPANALLGATPTLDKYWTGSPGAGVNADNFSVRWQRTDTFAAGTYRFTVTDRRRHAHLRRQHASSSTSGSTSPPRPTSSTTPSPPARTP